MSLSVNALEISDFNTASELSIFLFPELRHSLWGGNDDLSNSMNLLASPTKDDGQPFFKRGDGNLDGTVDISDPIAVLKHLYFGEILICEDAADFNDQGVIDIEDAISLLNFLFVEKQPIFNPVLFCGVDLTKDDLGCGNTKLKCD